MVRDHMRLQVGGFVGKVPDHLRRRSAAVDLFFKISERFDEEERRDASQEKIVEPHRLDRIQGLEKGLIEDEYRAGRHSSMIVLWRAGRAIE